MGADVNLVNPAYETAKSLKVMLTEQDLLNHSGNQAVYEYDVSDGVDKFISFASRVLPCHIEQANVIDIESY
jgi:glutamate racemase